MDDSVLDELVDFFQTSDELVLPTALSFTHLDENDLLGDTDSLLNSTLPPVEPTPVIRSNVNETKLPANETKLPVVKIEQQKQRSKDAIRRSEYRLRQKAEKEALRREIDELSAKLDKMQDSSQGDGDVSPSTNAALSNCLWKAISRRQKEHREAAELEQQRLRAAISSRAVLIQDLSGVLKKRVHGGAVTNGEFGDAPRLHKRVRMEPTDSALFETFIQELYNVYSQTDEVLSSCKLETVGELETATVTKHKHGNTEYYQHADRQTLPFNFNQICRSVWDLAQFTHRQEDREVYNGVEDPDNTFALKFRITSQRMGEDVSLLQRAVVSRFQEANRFVFVWKVFTEGEGPFRGMHSDETGWSVIRPSTSGVMAGTVLDTCFRHVPMHFSHSSDCEPVVNEFTDMVVSTGEEENKTLLQALEKMLIDDALAGVRTK